VTFLVSGTEVLTDEGAMAVWEVAVVDLFGVVWGKLSAFNVGSGAAGWWELTVQLMAV
jgi:hypothetical protein